MHKADGTEGRAERGGEARGTAAPARAALGSLEGAHPAGQERQHPRDRFQFDPARQIKKSNDQAQAHRHLYGASSLDEDEELVNEERDDEYVEHRVPRQVWDCQKIRHFDLQHSICHIRQDPRLPDIMHSHDVTAIHDCRNNRCGGSPVPRFRAI